MATVTIDNTTLSAAATALSKTITVASATGFAAGNLAFCDGECMEVTAVSGTTITVIRGVKGTSAKAHNSGAFVFCGAKKEFYTDDPSGTFVTGDEYALPHININNGNIWDGAGSNWHRVRLGGYGLDGAPQEYDYTAAGAISLAPGTHKVNGTTLAMTLANPSPYQNGLKLTVTAANASAHTLTVTGGFGGGGAGEDVATFGGSIGDSITVVAADSLWHVVGTHQVTLA